LNLHFSCFPGRSSFRKSRKRSLRSSKNNPREVSRPVAFVAHFVVFCHHIFFYFMLDHVPATQDVLEEIYGTDGLEDQLHPKFSETNFYRGFSGFSGFS